MIRYATQNEANMSEAELSSTADKLAQTFVDEASLVASFSNDSEEGASSGQDHQALSD